MAVGNTWQGSLALLTFRSRGLSSPKILNGSRSEWTVAHIFGLLNTCRCRTQRSIESFFAPALFQRLTYQLVTCERHLALFACVQIGSLSSTSDTDTNNKSCACAVLAKSQRRSVLEVATTEVRAILVVVGIERQTYIKPVFYSFLNKDVKYLFISIA